MASLDILIPHYNDPEGLALTLRSIERQTWEGDYRIVVADDGSRPEVQAALAAIAEHSELNIDLVFNEVNRGRPYTRNVLLDSIQGTYVAWLDAGDEWYPKKLATQFEAVSFIESAHMNTPFWVTCDYDWAWAGGKKRKISQRTNQDQIKALLIGSSLRAYLWTLLGTAESFKNVGWFDEKLPRLQDLDFFLRFVTHGGVIKKAGDGGPLCVYHKSDVGRDAQEIRLCNENIFNKHRVLFNRYGDGFVAMRIYKMEMLAARFAQNNKSHDLKRHYMWNAFKAKPLVFLGHLKKNGFRA